MILLRRAFLPLTLLFVLGFAWVQAQPDTDTNDWKSYHSRRHGFMLRYPKTMDPMEEDHLSPDFNAQENLLPWVYNPPRLSSQLRVGLAPTFRDRLTAQTQIYVTAEVPKFFHLEPHVFMGHSPIIPAHGHMPPLIAGYESTVIDYYDDEHLIHNVFVAHSNRVYLFVIRDPSPDAMETFNTMLTTVRFLQPSY